jgi:hypothetical protein
LCPQSAHSAVWAEATPWQAALLRTAARPASVFGPPFFAFRRFASICFRLAILFSSFSIRFVDLVRDRFAIKIGLAGVEGELRVLVDAG